MSDRRVYAVPFSAVSVGAAIQDLWEIQPADDFPVEFVGWKIGQTSDSGDAQDEQIQITVVRGHSTIGSGGSTPTISPVNPNDPAASFTAKTNNTTIASSGTGAVAYANAFNVRAGADEYLPVELRPKAKQGNTTMVVRISAPADALTMTGVLYVAELI